MIFILKKAIIMHINEPKNADPRHCDIEMLTMWEAGVVCLLVIVCMVFIWVMTVFECSGRFNEAGFLDVWLTSPQAIHMGCAGLGLFAMVVLIGVTQEGLRIAWEFERDGITVQGEIIDKWEEDAGGEGGTDFFVGYQFSYMDASWVGKKTANYSRYNKLQIGDYVTIRFLSRDPSISRMEGVAANICK